MKEQTLKIHPVKGASDAALPLRVQYFPAQLCESVGIEKPPAQPSDEAFRSTVIVIDPSKEERTQEPIARIVATLSGAIKLCHPYFDAKAYQLLKRYLQPEKIESIKVIHGSNKIDANQPYRIGRHPIEFRRKQGKHDRFRIDDRHLYVLGTSLNHIGDKLSFIFDLSVYQSKFAAIFQDQWNSA